MTTPQNPPRVIHLIAEIIKGVSGSTQLPPRYSRARRLLDPDTRAQLETFLSSPPELLPGQATARLATTRSATQRAYPRAPFFLNNVPAIAQLTLPQHKLFVRPVFGKLLDGMLRDLPDKKRVVYVTGTSGAGKTAFLWYAFHALCWRGRYGRYLAPPMDIVLDVPRLFLLITTAGDMFTGPRNECFRIELVKKETLYLVDLAHGDHEELLVHKRVTTHEHVMAGRASRLLVGLPRQRVDRRTRDRDHVAVRLLPLWKDCELELCRRACFPALDKSLVLARTKLWGRQPLWTLAMDPADGVGEQRLTRILRDRNFPARAMEVCLANEIRDAMSLASVELVQARDDATRLLVLQRPPNDGPDSFWSVHALPEAWRIGWCSPVVRYAAFQRVCDAPCGDGDSTLELEHKWRLTYIDVTGWPRPCCGGR